MEFEKIAVLGAGSIRCMPAVAASLAAFFGERPLEIRLFDSDLERVDLFDRFCRMLLRFNQSGHVVTSTIDPIEAIESTRVILCVDQNCAEKYFRTVRRAGTAIGSQYGLVEQFVEAVMPSVPDHIEVLSLLGESTRIPFPHYRRLDWPPPLTPDKSAAIPHQILRFLSGEDYAHSELAAAKTSPVKAWLENVEAIPSVLGRREA